MILHIPVVCAVSTGWPGWSVATPSDNIDTSVDRAIDLSCEGWGLAGGGAGQRPGRFSGSASVLAELCIVDG
jgi:hypothetical protein